MTVHVQRHKQSEPFFPLRRLFCSFQRILGDLECAGEETAWKQIGFVSVHFLHIFVVGWLFRGMDVPYIVAVCLCLILSSAVIVCVPLRIQRSVALLLACGAILLSQYAFSPTPGLEWFIPFLFIKLLVGHLTVEEPYV